MKSEQIKFHNSITTAPSFTEQVSDSIKDLILRGVYEPDQRLNEKEISRSLGISRSPIREAIQRLNNEGLVRLSARKGAFVASLNLNEIMELYEVREPLEVAAVRLAADRADQSQLNYFSNSLQQTKILIENILLFWRNRSLCLVGLNRQSRQSH